jgi:hypothetical protein
VNVTEEAPVRPGLLPVLSTYDTNSVPRLVEDQGLTVVDCKGEPGRVRVLARTQRRSSKAPSNAGSVTP